MAVKSKNRKQKTENRKPEIRFLYDMKKVLYDQKWVRKAPNFPVYYMYRGVRKKGDLRYDITIIPPRMLGKEFVRTKGNRNWKKFSELYTVIQGKAIFLMQKMQGKILKDVMVVKAKKGDWIIIPPKYYVITINPLKKSLKIGNWVSEKNKNIYKELEKMGGASYYYTKFGWVRNKNYKKVPKLRFEKPLNPVRKTKVLKAIEFLKFSNGVKKMPKDLGFLK